MEKPCITNHEKAGSYIFDATNEIIRRQLFQSHDACRRKVTAHCFSDEKERGKTIADLVKHVRPRWTPAPDCEVSSRVVHNLHVHVVSRLVIQSAVTDSRKKTMYEVSRRMM